MNIYELFIKRNWVYKNMIRSMGMIQKWMESNKQCKEQWFMSDNIGKDAMFMIKHAWYVYVCDFKYIVCCSEYLFYLFIYLFIFLYNEMIFVLSSQFWHHRFFETDFIIDWIFAQEHCCLDLYKSS